eukprot:766550-Hanusia_phi.AAC.3
MEDDLPVCGALELNFDLSGLACHIADRSLGVGLRAEADWSKQLAELHLRVESGRILGSVIDVDTAGQDFRQPRRLVEESSLVRIVRNLRVLLVQPCPLAQLDPPPPPPPPPLLLFLRVLLFLLLLSLMAHRA